MPGHVSWRIAIDEPAALHLVLFVRDCYRLSTGGSGQPGPLAPAVPDLSGLMDEPMRYAASAAWQTWWQAAAEACGVASRPLPHDASSAARHSQAWPPSAAAVAPPVEPFAPLPPPRPAAP